MIDIVEVKAAIRSGRLSIQARMDGEEVAID